MLMVCLVITVPFSNTWVDTILAIGGTIERWEDHEFRKCFSNILSGNWRLHDPYELESRLNARSSLYGRPSQVSLLLIDGGM